MAKVVPSSVRATNEQQNLKIWKTDTPFGNRNCLNCRMKLLLKELLRKRNV
jgi:hypothetical protein